MCVCDCIETVQWEAYLNTRLSIPKLQRVFIINIKQKKNPNCKKQHLTIGTSLDSPRLTTYKGAF